MQMTPRRADCAASPANGRPAGPSCSPDTPTRPQLSLPCTPHPPSAPPLPKTAAVRSLPSTPPSAPCAAAGPPGCRAPPRPRRPRKAASTSCDISRRSRACQEGASQSSGVPARKEKKTEKKNALEIRARAQRCLIFGVGRWLYGG